MRGLGSRPGWVARLAAAWLLVLGAAGCYETHYQVFSRADAVLVPGLEGRYLLEVDSKSDKERTNVTLYTVSRVRAGNDYRLRGEAITGEWVPFEPESGVFRAVQVSENFYLVQRPVRSAEPDLFFYVFFRVVRSGHAIVRIEQLDESDWPQSATVMAIAQRDGVDQWNIGGGIGLSGSPAALKRFLLDIGHFARQFETQVSYTRIP